jgi:Cu(I)/Ag(I) efflux system membrane fusion protein
VSKCAAAFRRQLGDVLEAYLGVAAALAADDAAEAEQAAEAARSALAGVDMALLGHEEHVAWMETLPELRQGLAALAEAEGLEAMRAALDAPSVALVAAIERLGVQPAREVYVLLCPMAAGGGGAVWLQLDDEVRNPYFGAAMLTCGQVQEVIEPEGDAHE